MEKYVTKLLMIRSLLDSYDNHECLYCRAKITAYRYENEEVIYTKECPYCQRKEPWSPKKIMEIISRILNEKTPEEVSYCLTGIRDIEL